MIRFISSSDEHLADSAGFRNDDYRSAILDKLEWQGELARKTGADGVIRAGDFFHVKPANKTTMSTLGMAANIHRCYPCPTYVIAGNHDLSHNDPDTVYKQPLGVMIHSEVFSHIRSEVFISGTLKVRVIGVDYTTDLDYDGLRSMVARRPDDMYTIAVVHALAAHSPAEKIQSFFNEKIFDYRDLVYNGCPDAYVFGHYHKDQGIVDHCGTKFVNLGAVARGSLTFEEIERKPKVAIISCTSQGISIEECEIPCRDASVIFNLDLKKQLEKERQCLDEFISKLYSDKNLSEDGGLREKLKTFQESDYPDDLKKLIVEIMEAAEAESIDG
jgi:DNA repair exonuclease SbcCD nuclease subunit